MAEITVTVTVKRSLEINGGWETRSYTISETLNVGEATPEERMQLRGFLQLQLTTEANDYLNAELPVSAAKLPRNVEIVDDGDNEWGCTCGCPDGDGCTCGAAPLAPPHWGATVAGDAFKDWAMLEMGLSVSELRQTLEVDKLIDYPGSEYQAIHAVWDYVGLPKPPATSTGAKADARGFVPGQLVSSDEPAHWIKRERGDDGELTKKFGLYPTIQDAPGKYRVKAGGKSSWTFFKNDCEDLYNFVDEGWSSTEEPLKKLAAGVTATWQVQSEGSEYKGKFYYYMNLVRLEKAAS